MHQGKEVLVYDFCTQQYFKKSDTSPQSSYLWGYLQGLSVEVVIEEPNYFDRDYLAEFSAFYSLSARGYPNICKRLHFFSSKKVTKELFIAALGGDPDATEHIQDTYLGFSVIRPIEKAPLARTVLAWFPDKDTLSSRVINPARIYTSTLAGLELTVEGLAWQQQDQAVSACATIGLWTMLHSSAFDSFHSIPTTVEITQAAHAKSSYGTRAFPSKGLRLEQILEAIKEQRLAPSISQGDIQLGNGSFGFTKSRFASSCAAFIRSGYPVLIAGSYLNGASEDKHVICATGFRESSNYSVAEGEYCIMDECIEIIYAHDDNIGPNVRWEISVGPEGAAIIKTSTPAYVPPESQPEIPTLTFRPEALIVALHEEVRISADEFFIGGIELTHSVCEVLNQSYNSAGVTPLPSLLFSTRFLQLKNYISTEISRVFHSDAALLANVRLALIEKAPPMSLHVGIVRIAAADADATLFMDVIYDTSDSDRNKPVFAHIVYDSGLDNLLNRITPDIREAILGVSIQGY